MIGDGATDMEARDIPRGADAFIGYGGVRCREAVLKGADWFVNHFHELRSVVCVKPKATGNEKEEFKEKSKF